MLNSINITGRITADPEIKSTQSGIAVCSFSIACDRDFKNKETGQRETDFFDCVAWRHTAEFMGNYVRKGTQITVSGRLLVENYTDKDGNKRKSVKIQVSDIYLPPKEYNEQPTQQSYPQPNMGYQTNSHQQGQQQAHSNPQQPQIQNNAYVPPGPQQGYPPQGQQYAPPTMPPSQGYGTPPQGQIQTGQDEDLPF